jgi:hypothetical protein
MRSIIPPLAEFLLNEKVDENTVAGPCFNYYKLDATDPRGSIKKEIAVALGKYTGERKKDLEGIQGSIDNLKQLPAVDT